MGPEAASIIAGAVQAAGATVAGGIVGATALRIGFDFVRAYLIEREG